VYFVYETVLKIKLVVGFYFIFGIFFLKIYLKKGRVKLEIGLAKSKNKGDKRQDLKKKESQREMDRATKKSRQGY